MSTFKIFADAVAKRYNHMANGELFVVDVADLFATYLAAFPEGTDPIFRVRTVHDCNADKNFIRRLGNVIMIDAQGMRHTVWDVPEMPEPYSTVANALRNVVLQAPIKSVFRTKERAYGSKPNWDNHDSSIRWEHFYGEVANRHHDKMPETKRGERDAIAQVLRRGLDELNASDMETVLDLIEAKALYRGEEHVASIKGFRQLQAGYVTASDRDTFVWSHLDDRNARFRNTVIGTLLVDLADNVELEQAVKKFEAKVAPENYKRPTALITPKMIEQAVAKLDELGLTEAIERRYAVIEDVNVNDVLFVDNEVRGKMKGGLTELLMSSSKTKPSKGLDMALKAAQPISIEDFMKLGAEQVELVLSNNQLGNFVSLTAPQHADTGRLFKWDNDFAWMYDGEVADSLKERVKAAGGKTGANVKLRVSLGWSNRDDLDIHSFGPEGHVYYGDRKGVLDVDMNAFGVMNAIDPVENLSWMHPRDGVYKISVDLYSKRSTENIGFSLEVENNGKLEQFTHSGDPKSKSVHLTLTVRDGIVTKIEPGAGIKGGSAPVQKWGISTNTPVRVDTIMLSPNFWEGAGSIGNRHWFFMLDNCVNPEATRGFVNEFLRGSLDPHRKVFEVLSSKTKCPPSDRQLSGVGFSSTRGDKVIAIADGRTYSVEF